MSITCVAAVKESKLRAAQATRSRQLGSSSAVTLQASANVAVGVPVGVLFFVEDPIIWMRLAASWTVSTPACTSTKTLYRIAKVSAQTLPADGEDNAVVALLNT